MAKRRRTAATKSRKRRREQPSPASIPPADGTCLLLADETRDVLLVGVLRLLGPPDLARFGTTCRRAHELARSDVIWRRVLRLVFRGCDAYSAIKRAASELGPLVVTRCLYQCKLHELPWQEQPSKAIGPFLSLCHELVAPTPPPPERRTPKLHAEPSFDPSIVVQSALGFMVGCWLPAFVRVGSQAIQVDRRTDLQRDFLDSIGAPELLAAGLRSTEGTSRADDIRDICDKLLDAAEKTERLKVYLCRTRMSRQPRIAGLAKLSDLMNGLFTRYTTRFSEIETTLDQTDELLQRLGFVVPTVATGL
eukprot:TRINITY_DN11490_c0_g1_i1.p1 TRINITY_DN11490_c0_g1~~TRINITY_DN11490_c0_g1_i1.p1  ORF type:complete len:352 (+),score=62.07 TRINITY_DN11490_c0_g1_i1:136-1056(+)